MNVLPVLSLDRPWADAVFIVDTDGRDLKTIETRGNPLNGDMRPPAERCGGKAMGYERHRIITYTLLDEPGTSLLAAGWTRWLVNTGRSRLLEGMEADPDFYDAQVAGWWVWGVNAWIGSGWCSGDGPWVDTGDGIGKRPHLGDAGQGVNRQLPHLGDAGRGVNRKLPHLGNAGRAGYNNMEYRPNVLGYFEELAGRLRDVRVCCGDWSRVCTSGAMSYGSRVGVFLDPPYLGDVRTADLYAVDDHTIAHAVRDWCLEHGDDPRLRIVLAGYRAEHDDLMPDTWRRHYYSASAAYSTTESAARQDGNHANRANEVLWFSPHCVTPDRQGELWEAL